MRRAVAVAMLGALLIAAPVLAQDDVIDKGAEPRFLVVVSGASGSVVDGILTLEGVPSAVVFSDRPERFAGHLPVADLVADWGRGSDSFAADPPNAALSVLRGDEPEITVIELTAIAVDEAGVHFDFVPLQGTVPEGAFDAASLFIDDMRTLEAAAYAKAVQDSWDQMSAIIASVVDARRSIISNLRG